MLLWDVDTQVDFMSPEGGLYVPGAERIVPNLRRLTRWAADNGVPVISSACAHRPGDPELEGFGPHCMVGTAGQQKIAETLLPRRLVVPNRPMELPDLGAFQQIILEKQAFNVFTNPNAEEVVRRFGESFPIVLYGVVTEICVASAVWELMERGHRVQLVRDAVAALDPARAEGFLESFRERGGTIVQADAITRARAA
jgi:nicotinamidase/pyrazinamidase